MINFKNNGRLIRIKSTSWKKNFINKRLNARNGIQYAIKKLRPRLSRKRVMKKESMKSH